MKREFDMDLNEDEDDLELIDEWDDITTNDTSRDNSPLGLLNSNNTNIGISSPTYTNDPRIETLLSALWEQAFSKIDEEEDDRPNPNKILFNNENKIGMKIKQEKEEEQSSNKNIVNNNNFVISNNNAIPNQFGLLNENNVKRSIIIKKENTPNIITPNENNNYNIIKSPMLPTGEFYQDNVFSFDHSSTDNKNNNLIISTNTDFHSQLCQQLHYGNNAPKPLLSQNSLKENHPNIKLEQNDGNIVTPSSTKKLKIKKEEESSVLKDITPSKSSTTSNNNKKKRVSKKEVKLKTMQQVEDLKQSNFQLEKEFLILLSTNKILKAQLEEMWNLINSSQKLSEDVHKNPMILPLERFKKEKVM